MSQYICSYGVTVELQDRKVWLLPSAGTQFPTEDAVRSFLKNNRLRILAVSQIIDGQEAVSVLNEDGKRLLNNLLVDAHLHGNITGLSEEYKVHHVSYLVDALLYHCQRMAILYRDTSFHLQRFRKARSHVKPEGPQPIQGYGIAHVWHEFEAFVTTARRTYDSMRYLLIKKYGKIKNSPPTSFKKTLPECQGIPTDLQHRLERSWIEFGELITAYRDCIQHYVPVDWGFGSALEIPMHGITAVLYPIPDNPSCRSKRQFSYDNRLDALEFSWNAVQELHKVATIVVAATA